MVESLSGKPPIKRLWKEATNVEKKKKIMGKIVMGKKTKGFDLVECHVKDVTIRKEYANMFQLGFAPVKDVRLLVNRFKRSSPKIVYYPLSREHVNKIKTQIVIYNKYDTKVPIFVIPEDPERPNFILPHHPKKWEEIHNLQFLIVGKGHTIMVTKVSFICFTS
jgi:hypothetical protein